MLHDWVRAPADVNAVQLPAAGTAGHVESFFFKANAPDGQRALWLKFTLFAPVGQREPLAEVWAIRFTRGGPQRVARQSFADSRWCAGQLDLRFGPCRLTAGQSSGALDCDGATLAWDLRFSTEAPALLLFPLAAMYGAPLPRSKALSPYPQARISGQVSLGAERWELDGWLGMQGHNWGRRHAEEYVWAHCNLADPRGEPAGLFEGVSARVAVGALPLLTPPLTALVLQRGAQRLRFNGLRQLVATRSAFAPVRWEFEAHRPDGQRLSGLAQAAPADVVGLHYDNPDGTLSYCLNSKLARLELTLRAPGQPDWTLVDERCALEIGTRDPGHGIAMRA